MVESDTPLAVGTKVRFLDSFLNKLTEKEAARLRGRVGQVTGYRLGATSPIVLFEKSGRRPELKLFEVSVNRLEVVSD